MHNIRHINRNPAGNSRHVLAVSAEKVGRMGYKKWSNCIHGEEYLRYANEGLCLHGERR